MKKEKILKAVFIFLILVVSAGAGSAAPANDSYQNPVVTTLNAPLIEIEGTNFGATKESAEPFHARNIGGQSVWYRIVPQETTIVRIWVDRTSAADTFNTLLAVYKGNTPSPLNLVAENDDMGYSTLSEVSLTVQPGNIYLVAVDGFNNNGNIAQGNFRIRFEKLGVPINDQPIVSPDTRFPTQVEGFAAGTNRNATKDAGELDITANAGGKSVWYIWTAPDSRAMTVRVSCNSLVSECFDMQLGVFKGNFNKIASNDDYDNTPNVSQTSFFAEEGETYGFVIDGIRAGDGTVSEGNFMIEFFPTKYSYDTNFDSNDRKSDIGVFRPSEGVWYSLKSTNNQPRIAALGSSGDIPIQADYDGDAVTDYAVVRNNGQQKNWYILNSSNNSVQVVNYGLTGDKPLVGDYDGDGKADMVAVRPTGQNLVWYIRNSGSPNNATSAYTFGLSTDQPIVGNFLPGAEIISGLAAADLAVVRSEANGKKTWHLMSTTLSNYKQIQFGLASDKNVPADYDNDGYADIAVWRPGTGVWYIYDHSTNQFIARQWGTSGDIPVPAQLDGTGAPELAIFRPSTGQWWIYPNAGTAQPYVVQWGASGDIPISSLTSLMNP